MITRKGATLVLSQSRHFLYGWRNLERRRVGFLAAVDNPKLESRAFVVQNVSCRCMSVAKPASSETDVEKFLNYLIKAYTKGTPTEFDRLLQFKPISKLLNERLKIVENLESLEELGKDKEMKKLVEEETSANERQLKKIDDELIELIIKNLVSNTYDDIIMEINAGVGGQEAMLFVRELLEMYASHLDYLGYKYEVIDVDYAAQGGYRQASIIISGKGAFDKFKHEAGNHRVQRVPATEKTGRIHTSVVSVAVLPQPSEIEVEIDPKDLRVDTMKASGAGGQHVNTTDSAVRLVHIPTGITVECQEGRSQIKNRDLALKKLRTKLYQLELDKQTKNVSSMRKQQMGMMGERNEKIRTYNFNQDRVTDHRLAKGSLHNIKGFLEGGEALNDLHAKLDDDLRHKILSEVVKSIK